MNTGLYPAWFAKDRNISYEEANQKYNDGITWKRTVHEKFGTKLIATSSADFSYSDVREKLKSQLTDAGVSLQERSDEELYGMNTAGRQQTGEGIYPIDCHVCDIVEIKLPILARGSE